MSAGKTEEIKTGRALLLAAWPPPPPARAWVESRGALHAPLLRRDGPGNWSLGSGGGSEASVPRPHPKFKV